VLIREPKNSVYRFWLAACVESFLRGSHPPFQELVAASGLMAHLIEEILAHDELQGSGSTSTQNFDLLGELLKFNRHMFTLLDDLLEGVRFDRFVEVRVPPLTHTPPPDRSLSHTHHPRR